MMHIDPVNPIVENAVTQYLKKYFPNANFVGA